MASRHLDIRQQRREARLGPGSLAVFAAVVAAGSLLSAGAQGADKSGLPGPALDAVNFERDVKAVFAARCHVCHGPAQQMQGLRLDRGADALRGGYSGPVIVPGKSAESKLIQMVAGAIDGKIMPPAGEALTEHEISLLRTWIDQGAVWPDSETQPESAPVQATTHWAFQTVSRPEPPAVQHRSWVRNPIDRFILERLHREGVEPSPEAPRATLARRLSLDLTGLPLTLEEQEELPLRWPDGRLRGLG